MIALTHIGKVLKTTGVNGWLKILVEDPFISSFSDVEFIFLDLDGSKIPFFIEGLEFKNQLLIKLKDVNSETEAKFLSRCDLWLESKYVSDVVEETSSLVYEKFIGYTLVDENSGWNGLITGISAFPEQEIAHVSYKDEEVLIPLNDDLISRVESITKEIYLDLPEGLIQLNN